MEVVLISFARPSRTDSSTSRKSLARSYMKILFGTEMPENPLLRGTRRFRKTIQTRIHDSVNRNKISEVPRVFFLF
ncbi:hypothetical protein DLM75_11680 [Leptospira stimsonii]|uniref:Uncharacterized protein n=1 Tax=Leptospira stimsonii TaxID=2202203 RepID=A0A396Z4G1_9LEPT|nr:hypothetical protein DLM75_11680 [Leptospira stimsonii]